jgi:ectoine hydroxylase-related dioxygenase (phytanoyl-CoA dioxygenase family)
VWNALEKLATRDPDTFVDYYANDIVALVSRAWLGPGYQVTSQVNVVRPGGKAQEPHRDYHLGFLENEVVEQYPTHVHLLSPVLTLQGAVAHSDMPVESGPTMYLPYSHQFVAGYLAWRLPEFREYFAQHYVQLPLAKGDAVFFNPALFHGAGTNVSADIQRVANLLQVSSAFGRAMESVDRDVVTRAVYPILLDRKAAGVPDPALQNALTAAAEGYPFPTNLDLDQPVDGLTPASQAEIVHDALTAGVTPEDLGALLDGYVARRITSRSH